MFLVGVLGALDLLAQFIVEAQPWQLAVGAVFAYLVNLPLLVRREFPIAVFTTIGALVLLRGLGGLPALTGCIPLLVAAYALGRYGANARRPWVVRVVAAWGGVHAALVGMFYEHTVQLADWLVVACAVGVSYLLGAKEHSFSEHISSLRRGVRRQSERRTLAVQQAVGEERERIACDLHDVVGHHLSTLSVQTHVFEQLLDHRDADVAAVATQIRESSRQAITEMVRMQNALRGLADGGNDTTCGYESVTRLATAARNAGNDVEFSVDELPGNLSEEVGTEGYRVLQEALTNVVKHASPTKICICVGVDDGALRLQVTNGPPPSRGHSLLVIPGGGLGLRSMRQRVARLGGRLSVGMEPGGGYSVDARIPLRSAS